MTLTIKDGRDKFYTFDTDRILLLSDDDGEVEYIHLETNDDTDGTDKAWSQKVLTNDDGNRYIQVPQEFLEGDYSRLVAYFYCKDADGNYTDKKQVFRIVERQEPEGYFISYTERATWDSIRSLAEKYRDEAKASAEASATSEGNAKTSETNASSSEANALAYRNTTKTYMDTTKGYMDSASASATEASTSEANAKTSEENAKASELASSTSESNAKTSESNAKQSETNAKSSETVASTKAEETSQDRSAVSTMKSDVATMKGEVSDMKASVEATKALADKTESAVKEDLVTLEGIETRVESMESNVTSMQTDVTKSKEYVHERIDYLEGSLTGAVDNARQTVQGYIEEADESESRITALRTQLQTLVDKVESLSAQTVTETIIVDGSKVYKKSVTIKNGRPYCTLTEVTE